VRVVGVEPQTPPAPASPGWNLIGAHAYNIPEARTVRLYPVLWIWNADTQAYEPREEMPPAGVGCWQLK
jgi:hypothetical protein